MSTILWEKKSFLMSSLATGSIRLSSSWEDLVTLSLSMMIIKISYAPFFKVSYIWNVYDFLSFFMSMKSYFFVQEADAAQYSGEGG